MTGSGTIDGGDHLVTGTPQPGQAATVAVAVDTRLGGRLPWMDTSWADTGMQLTDNESHPVTFEVYQKNFPAGQVSLGPQDLTDTSSMYTIIVY